MDADAVITRFNVDVRSIIKPDKDLYMVQHEYNGKDNPIPNSGFLVIRNTSWSKKLLEEIWQKKEYINHKWWENAALIDIMGYKNLVGGVRNLNHEMLAKVEFISSEWNYLPMLEVVAEPIVTHFAGMSRDDRLSQLPKTAMQAIQNWTENTYPENNDARPAGYLPRLGQGLELEAQKVQQEEVERSVVEVKKEIVAEIHSLIANLVEKGVKNRLAVSAWIDSVKNGMEGRKAKMAEYAVKIQDAVVSPSSHPILRLFSWHTALSRIRKIKKPSWLHNSSSLPASPPRPVFLRRLERSIRKRRKRWIARIGFDQKWYLHEYPEVGSSGIDPLDHYLRFGVEEGRWKSGRHKEKALASGTLREKKPGFFRRLEISIRKRKKRLFGRIGFDREWYLQEYPEVRFSSIEPLEHYVFIGKKEGRWRSRKQKAKYDEAYRSKLMLKLSPTSKKYFTRLKQLKNKKNNYS
jgi:hypothetical protein